MVTNTSPATGRASDATASGAREHWNRVYTSRADHERSWFEATPTISLALMESAGLSPETSAIDVGGGDSRLVDHLVLRGLRRLTVLDVSDVAIARARARLGPVADELTWLAADVTGDWSSAPVDIWHDRATFHFLTEAGDRARYLAHLRDTVRRSGTVIIATFGLTGPTTCSGLPVRRYSPHSLAAELGDDFRLIESIEREHHTPSGATQAFQYSRFVRVRGDAGDP